MDQSKDPLDTKKVSRRGRPTLLTDEVISIVSAYVAQGCYIETAVAAAGIKRDSFYEWMKLGRKDPDSIYGRFAAAMDKAIAESEIKDVLRIAEASKRHWQAAAWRLERRYPKRWGRRDAVEMTGEQTIRFVTKIADDGSVLREQRTIKDEDELSGDSD